MFYRFCIGYTNLYGKFILDEKLWAVKNKTQLRPVCQVCSSPVKFKDITYGFSETCSKKCAANNPATRQKTSVTNAAKYGSHPTQNKEWMQKQVEQQKANGSYAKGKETLKQRTGSASVFSSEAVKQKIKQTNLSKYGVENPLQSTSIKEKAKQTTLAKHGAFFNPEKAKQTNLERYGVENAAQNNSISCKIGETTLKRHGAFFNPKKAKQTNLQKYGVENPMQNAQVAAKTSKTQLQTFQDTQLTNRLAAIRELVQTEPLFTEWHGCEHHYEWKHSCGTVFKDNLVYGKLPSCPNCKPRSKF